MRPRSFRPRTRGRWGSPARVPLRDRSRPPGPGLRIGDRDPKDTERMGRRGRCRIHGPKLSAKRSQGSVEREQRIAELIDRGRGRDHEPGDEDQTDDELGILSQPFPPITRGATADAPILTPPSSARWRDWDVGGSPPCVRPRQRPASRVADPGTTPTLRRLDWLRVRGWR